MDSWEKGKGDRGRGTGSTRREVLGAGLGAGALLVLGGMESVLAQSPRRGGTMRIAFAGTPARIDPPLVTGSEETNLTRSIYDGLLYVDHDLAPQPELAESWEATPDAKTWTFHLRKGVRFHHGREFDADDVVFTFKRLLDPNVASPARASFSLVSSVAKLDKYIVRITLSAPFAEFPLLVGGNFQARLAPRDVSDLQKNPTGTGPFKLTEFVPGDHATLVRHDAYWRSGQPYLDQVRFVYLPEMASQVAGLLSGSIDMLAWPSHEVLPILEASKEAQVLSAPSNGYQPIVMAVDAPPFNDNRVRQAFKSLCDRQAMNRLVLGGRGAIGNDHPIPPNSPMYMRQTPRQQDIEKAKALLADAGYKDGLDLEMMAWTGRAGLVEEALAFQDMAKKANVRISVRTVPADVFLGKYWLKHSFFVTNWTGRTTLYELLAMAYYSTAKWNESHWRDKRVDGLIDGIRSEMDEGRRKALYAESQRLFIEEGPVIVPYHLPRTSALRRHVKGYRVHPAGWSDLRTTWLA